MYSANVGSNTKVGLRTSYLVVMKLMGYCFDFRLILKNEMLKDEADNIHDGSDYYLFEELFLRMIGICFIHCHNEQADECLYHLSRCKQDFFLLRQESENCKYCKKGHLG